MEAYVAPGDRRQRGRTGPDIKPYFHLVLLATNRTGYRNLVKLSSLGYTEGFYSKPRIDRELLEKYGEGPDRFFRLHGWGVGVSPARRPLRRRPRSRHVVRRTLPRPLLPGSPVSSERGAGKAERAHFCARR
jgi:hypothetical protein